MGGCQSIAGGGTLLELNDGDQAAYAARFIEDRVLGEGEFGKVKLVKEKNNPTTTYACKTLRKGAVFKDNTLYPPLPPDVLRGEVEMLRTLKGEHFCLKLIAIFETPKALLVVTDCCTGGEMMEYVSKQKEDLRTEDVSRISFQLLSAVDHCAKHNILHRDIKPENTMFVSEDPGAELRLIDFGSGTNKLATSDNNGMHTTFAGTPFYNSPEMFQKVYNTKTDVWSAGVALYVLVAGYPSESLQKAFNILLDSKRTSLKGLPNMPTDMPDSYFEMLDGILNYRHKQRKSAGDALQSDFVKFHQDLASSSDDDEEKGADKVQPLGRSAQKSQRMTRTTSFAIRGTVSRHSIFLDFKKFERSLTTLLATMLSSMELKKVLAILEERYASGENAHLQVVPVQELKDILRVELNNADILERVKKLSNAASYENNAYHISLLKEFAPTGNDDNMNDNSNRVPDTLSKQRKSVATFTSVRKLNTETSFDNTTSTATSELFTAGTNGTSLPKRNIRRAQSCAISAL